MATCESLRLDVAELEKLQEQATRQKVKGILLVEIRKLQTEISRKEDVAKAPSKEQCDGTAEGAAKPIRTARRLIDMKSYGWDQSEKFMKLYVTLNGVQDISKENTTVQFTDRGFCLRCNDLKGEDHRLLISRLIEQIIPAESYHKIKTDMVLLMLKKKAPGKTWAHVTEPEGATKEKKKPEPNENADPSDSMMTLLRQMYEDGDDEMKKSIAKAWTDSRGKTPDM